MFFLLNFLGMSIVDDIIISINLVYVSVYVGKVYIFFVFYDNFVSIVVG